MPIKQRKEGIGQANNRPFGEMFGANLRSKIANENIANKVVTVGTPSTQRIKLPAGVPNNNHYYDMDDKLILSDDPLSRKQKKNMHKTTPCKRPKKKKRSVSLPDISNRNFKFWYEHERGHRCASVQASSLLKDKVKWLELVNVHELIIDDEDDSDFKMLPDDFFKLKHLRALVIKWTNLNSLSQNTSYLPITHACLAQNKLQVLNGIEAMTRLTNLDVSNNNLSSLPSSIDELRSLKILNLNGNQLLSLPEQVGNLINLTHLFASSNKLSKIPDNICNLRKIEQMDISRNIMRILPDRIGMMSSLLQLSISYNYLNRLPLSIQHLSKLKHLYVHHNRLESLPQFLESLTKLETMNAEANRIVDINWVGMNLKWLQLTKNDIADISKGICDMKSLQFLSLRSNQIKIIPSSIGQLTSLRNLDLSLNYIEELPSEMGELTALRHLDLSNNSIGKLPGEMINLQYLGLCNLKSNPLNSLLQYANRGGVSSIKRVLSHQENENESMCEKNSITSNEIEKYDNNIPISNMNNNNHDSVFKESSYSMEPVKDVIIDHRPTHYGSESALHKIPLSLTEKDYINFEPVIILNNNIEEESQFNANNHKKPGIFKASYHDKKQLNTKYKSKDFNEAKKQYHMNEGYDNNYEKDKSLRHSQGKHNKDILKGSKVTVF